MGFPVISAIKNIPNQIALDSKSFSNPSHFETAKHGLFASNLIKALGALFLVGAASLIFKTDSKAPSSASATISKCLSVCLAILLSRESLIIGDNIFQLYCKRPARETIDLYDPGIKKMMQRLIKNPLLSHAQEAGVGVAKSSTGLCMIHLTEDAFRDKQASFILRNTLAGGVKTLLS